MELSIGKSRVEAFSDAVIAIIITVMVLELPYPDSNSLEQMKNFIIALFVFFDSFFIVGSFWHKHCLLFQKSEDVSSKMVWRNLLFLFTISLFPVFTKWVIADFGQVFPAIAYILLYIVSARCSMFLYGSGPSDKRKEYQKKGILGRNIVFIIATIFVVALTYLFPYVFSVLLIGMPLLNALSNLWIERQIPDEKNPRL